MSQIPTQPPYDPIFYASPHIQQKSPRPTSVTVIAVLAIIFGSLAVLGALCVLPQSFGLSLRPNPTMDAVRNDPILLSFSIFNQVIQLVFGVVLLITGISALSLKQWARVWMLRYAVAFLVFSILTTILNITVIHPRLQKAISSARPANSPLNTQQVQSILQITHYGGLCFATLFLLWPVAILYYMSRPHVKDAFARGMPAYIDRRG